MERKAVWSGKGVEGGRLGSLLRTLVPGASRHLSKAMLAFMLGLTAPAALAEVTLTTEYLNSAIAYRGDVRTLRITMLNSALVDVTSGELSSSDVLPAEFEIANPNGVSGTCGAAVTAAPGTRAVSFTGATIPAASGGTNGSCHVDVDVLIDVNPPSTTSYTTAVAAGLFSGSEGGLPVSNANPASIGLSVGSLGTLSVTKGFSPSTIRMGEPSTITITVTNPAGRPRETPITQLTENLPANVTATGTATGGTCGAGTASGTSGSVTISLTTPPTLNPGQSCTVTWPVRGNAANGNTSTNTNTVPANSVINDRGMPHSAASANITVQSPVTLTKNFQYDSVRPDQPVRMRIELANRSANPAAIAFTDNLPAGMVVSTPNGLSATDCGVPPSAVSGGTVVSLAGGTVGAGQTCRIDVDVQASDSNIDGGGNSIPYTNTIAGADWSQTVDGSPISGTTGSASDQVTVYNEFTIHKSIAGPGGESLAVTGIAAGDLVRFQINLRNYSAAPVTGVSVTDVLPQAGGAQLQVASSATPGGFDALTTCAGTPVLPANGATTAVFSGLTVPAGSGAQHGECYVRFWALVPDTWPAGTNISNDLSASPNFGIDCDGGGADCQIQTGGQNASVTVAGSANAQHLVVSKGFSPSTVTQGQVSVMTITLNNNGFWALNNASVEDALPAGLVVAPLPGASSTCGGAPVYEYLNDRALFRVSGLSVPARNLCRVSVNVVAAVAGSYANVIPPASVDATDTRDNRDVEPASPANATLTVTPTFSVAKSFSPTTVAQSGGVSRVTIAVSNNGSAALTGLRIDDPLAGTGLLVADTPAASTTCAGPVAITAVAGADQAQLSGAQVPAGTSCTFSFNVVTDGSLGGAASVNTLPPGAVTADGGLTSNTPSSATLTKLGGTGVPFVQKSFTPASLNTLGETSLLAITIDNTAVGTVNLTGVGLVDDMPEAIEVAALPQASTTCPGGVVSAVPGSNQVALSGASLGAGATCQISVRVALNRTGTHTNTVQPGWLINDQNVSNTNTFPANLGTVASAGVDKSFSPATVAPGEASLMTIRVVNQGNIQLTNLQITDNLPAGLVPATPHNANTTCGGALNVTPTQVTLSGGSVAPNAVCLLTLDMTAAVAGTYTNELPPGTVTAGEEPNLIPPGPPASGTLTVRDPLTVTKSFANATRLVNQANRLTITVTNPNPVPVTDVRLVDTYPDSVFNTTAPNPTVNCTSGVNGVVTAAPSGDYIRLTGATLAANGGSCTFSADVLSNEPGTYVNAIPESAVYSAEGVTNTNSTQDQFVVTEPPTLGKSFDPVQIASGGTAKLRIVLGNDNAAPITLSANLDDDLPQSPGAMTATAIDNALTSCTVGQVSLQNSGAGANTRVRYASGASIPAGGCVIVVDVTATVSGQYSNQIPAGGLNTSAGPNPEPATAILAVSTNHAITGKVYMDHDDNGLVGAVEPGVSAQSIELWRNGSLYQSTVTDSLGNYAFLELPDGTYEVRQPNQPANTTSGQTTPGSQGGSATGPAVVPSAISSIVLSGAGVTPMLSTDNNFGELAFAGISGKVFLDVNNNGTQQGSEPALGGQTVLLQRQQGAMWVAAGSLVTAADGSYAFAQLLPGTYRVVQPDQAAGTANGQTIAGTGSTTPGAPSNPNTAGQTSLIEGIVLASGESSVGNDFAEIPAGRSVYGRVFLDNDDNGVANGPDAGIGGQTVRLTGSDVNGNPVDRTAITTADGSFVFTGLPESDLGGYTLTQPNQPPGTLNGITTAGSAGGTPTARQVAPSRIEGIVLAGGVTVSANNLFAEILAPVVIQPDLVIAKTHQPDMFSSGDTGVYTLVPSNIGATATSGQITVVDTLPAGLALAGVPSGSGWNCAVSGSLITCRSAAVITPQGQGAPITVPVTVADHLAGQVVVNVATISGGGEPPSATGNNRVEDPTPVTGERSSLEGHVWRDLDHDRVLDPDEPRLPGWTVELLRNGALIDTRISDTDGHYIFTDLPPGGGYEVRFRDSHTGVVYGRAVPNEKGLSFDQGVMHPENNHGGATNTHGNLQGITLRPGTNTPEQSLPLDPSGVVYDSESREPVEGAVVSISGPPGFLPEHVLGGLVSQTTGPDGYYQFLLVPGAPAGVYTLTVISPPGYLPAPSSRIPACSATLQVGATPDPALVHESQFAPALSAPLHDPVACPASSAGLPGGMQSTQYYFSIMLDGSSADLVNNHIPLDPMTGAISMTKTTPLVNVGKGGLVPYVITARNTLSDALTDVTVRDLMPPGFQYRRDSASVRHGGSENFVAVDTDANGRELAWRGMDFAPGEEKTFRVVLVVGAGVGEGEYTNQTWSALLSARISNVANAVVRIIPDPVFDCAEIIGKVFDDRNANGYQDDGEPGIPNVRLATARGLLVTTDAKGRFHVPCAAVPNADRGSNFVMKLDERTLPSGFRVTTENPRDVRLTRGKMSKLNFGAAIHVVYRIEVDGRAWDGDALRSEWVDSLRALAPQLWQRPSVARLAYVAGEDDADLAQERLDALGALLLKLYREEEPDDEREDKDKPPLIVEQEIIGVAVRAEGAQQ